MKKPVYVEITTYKNHLIAEYKTTESNDVLVSPYDKTKNSMGYVLLDVGYAGISKEAHAMLSKIKKGNDSIGELDIFKDDKGNYVLATLGGMYFLSDITEIEGSRQYVVPGIENFQIIENNVPAGAKEVIDQIDERD